MGVVGAVYGVYVCATWLRYGHVNRRLDGVRDSFLDDLMPIYEVFEHHSVRVSASAGIAFSVASSMDLSDSSVVRAIFKAREMILSGTAQDRLPPGPLLAQVKGLGWKMLAEVQDREIVFGAVTRPWEADVVFRGLPADEFAAFQEPGYVKIAWTLRAEALAPNESILHTETRAVTTDALSRAKFRRYWSAFSPGIILIRNVLLRLARNEAERRTRRSAEA
jgi:hypothetical protein